MGATIHRAAFLIAGIVALSAIAAPSLARTPLIGVSCGGGFYVRAPTGGIYWVHNDPPVRDPVLDGSRQLMALAQCGSGVVSVTGDADRHGPSRVFHSSDCRNIGAATGATSLIHEGADAVAGLDIDATGLTIRLASGATVHSAICLGG